MTILGYVGLVALGGVLAIVITGGVLMWLFLKNPMGG